MHLRATLPFVFRLENGGGRRARWDVKRSRIPYSSLLSHGWQWLPSSMKATPLARRPSFCFLPRRWTSQSKAVGHAGNHISHYELINSFWFWQWFGAAWASPTNARHFWVSAFPQNYGVISLCSTQLWVLWGWQLGQTHVSTLGEYDLACSCYSGNIYEWVWTVTFPEVRRWDCNIWHPNTECIGRLYVPRLWGT